MALTHLAVGAGTARAAGLADRVAAGTAYAASRGTTLGFAVLDRVTGEYADNGAPAHQRIESASVVKVLIADHLLHRRDLGQVRLTQADLDDMGRMLRSSDDAAANRFWSGYGTNGIVSEVIARYGLAETGLTSNVRYWGNTLITAHDMVRYYHLLLSGGRGLSAASRDFLVAELRRSTPRGTDGSWQWFGLRDGLQREDTIGQKQGWMCCVNGAVYRHTSGFVGPDARFVVVALSKEPSTAGAGHVEASLTGAIGRAFPEGSLPRGSTLIDQVWTWSGGMYGPLGAPAGPETAVAGGSGAFRWYQRGAIYWSPGTGAHWMVAGILTSWVRQGYENGPLGYPVSDEAATPTGGSHNWFQRGAVYWSPRTGAHWMVAGIL
ncbi:serine hydrolase, partial [Geodermatophilus amargosae]|uniref:serine hydrolase n=1 Tax=Geodermatophilus amargosae TaxID=1296565 RepID=UPI0034DF1EFB